MSLQVWLPLNGSTINQGIADFQPAAADITYVDVGKIGAKCCSGGSLSMSAEKTASILNNQAVTIAFWIKTLANSAAQIFGNDNGMGANNNRKFALWQYPTGQDFHWSWMNDAASVTFTTGTIIGVLPLNTWTHVCITYNNPNVTIYINGQEKTTASGISNSSTFAYDTTILHSNSNRHINDFRIYDHCLSPREVKLLAQGLIAHYKLDGNEIENPNLVNDSVGDYTSGEYLIHTYSFDRAGFGRYLAPGEKCTLTVCFTPAADFGYFNPHINSGARGGWMPEIYSDGTTNRQIATAVSLPDWKYLNDAGNVVTPENEPARANVCMYHRRDPNNAGSSGTTIHWIKLQVGDHPEAQTWSPSISENPTQYLLEDDCSGYGNHGTGSSPFGLTSDSPRYKNCKNFENNKYIDTGTNTTGQTDLTMTAWVNPTTFTNGDDNNCIITGGAYLTISSTGKVYTYFYGKNKEGYHTGATTLSLNQWSHIAAVWDESKKQHIIYVNGNPDLTVENCYGAASVNHTYKCIGRERTWRSFNGKISDARIYATALSAAAVKELYQSSISFLDNGTLQCSEIVESPTNLKYNQNGIVQAKELNEIGYIDQMQIKTLSDGSAWARIHWLDVSSNATYFTNEAEVKYCVNQSNRFSLMEYVEYFKSKENKYEFMLTYPALSSTGYNRWRQTSSPNASSVAGYEPVSGQISWSAHCAGLRAHNPGSCIYNCDSGGTWYAPIGQLGHGNWNGAGSMIPAANGSNTSSTELWVRIDNLPKLKKLSMFNKALQTHQIYEL